MSSRIINMERQTLDPEPASSASTSVVISSICAMVCLCLPGGASDISFLGIATANKHLSALANAQTRARAQRICGARERDIGDAQTTVSVCSMPIHMHAVSGCHEQHVRFVAGDMQTANLHLSSLSGFVAVGNRLQGA